MNVKTAPVRLVVVLAFCALSVASAIASPDEAAIVAGTKKYLAAHSYSVAEMTIKLEKVSGDYARVAVEPKKKDMDGATLFLKREHGAWKGLAIGPGWDPADLDKLYIPKSLRP